MTEKDAFNTEESFQLLYEVVQMLWRFGKDLASFNYICGQLYTRNVKDVRESVNYVKF